jgi:hypothetical protein
LACTARTLFRRAKPQVISALQVAPATHLLGPGVTPGLFLPSRVSGSWFGTGFSFRAIVRYGATPITAIGGVSSVKELMGEQHGKVPKPAGLREATPAISKIPKPDRAYCTDKIAGLSAATRVILVPKSNTAKSAAATTMHHSSALVMVRPSSIVDPFRRSGNRLVLL